MLVRHEGKEEESREHGVGDWRAVHMRAIWHYHNHSAPTASSPRSRFHREKTHRSRFALLVSGVLSRESTGSAFRLPPCREFR